MKGGDAREEEGQPRAGEPKTWVAESGGKGELDSRVEDEQSSGKQGRRTAQG